MFFSIYILIIYVPCDTICLLGDTMSKSKNKGNLYYEKLEWFSGENNFREKYFLKRVAPADFYRDIFPVGSFQDEQGTEYKADGKGNGFLVYKTPDEKFHHRLVFDNLHEIFNSFTLDTVFMSPISYFGRQRTSANARELFALVFDIDEVGEKNLDHLFGWYFEREVRPVPTYIVVSGGGIHLYYVFEKPIPMYPNIQVQLKKLKYELTTKLWNKDTSQLEKRQYQGINQGFRLVGSGTKSGRTVVAYKTGEKINLEYLSQFVSPENKITDTFYHSKLTLEEAKKKYPDWYHQRIELGRKKKNWTCKRDLYDWWKNKITEVEVHHRYFFIMALACYAIKCGIEYEELKKDAYSFLDYLNDKGKKQNNPFTKNDLKSALEMYQESYRSFPRADIEKLTGIEIPKNKRNGRTQAQHLLRARAMRDINQAEKGTTWNGRKSYKDGVFKYLEGHLDGGNYIHFCELTGMKKSVYYKYKKEWLESKKE